MKGSSHVAQGFTIVELITVIMLLGILSAVAIARSGKTSDFEPRLFASTAAEQYRFAHNLSTGRFDDPVRFSITSAGGIWQFVTASDAEGEVRREEMADAGVSLLVSNGTTSLAASAGNSLQIDFAPNGDVSAASLGAVTLQIDLGVGLRIAGDSTHELCVYPTGYLSQSGCE